LKALGVTHLGLASALETKGGLDEAAGEYREYIRLAPTDSQGYEGLGLLLAHQGKFAEARETLRLGQEKASRDRNGAADLAHTLQVCDYLAKLDGKLSEVLAGEAQPANNAERLELARWCVRYKKSYFAAARLFRDAFAQEPATAEDMHSHDRYNAACAAALAGCGRGRDAGGLDEEERARLRRQALDWLRANLDAWRGLLERDPGKAGRPAGPAMLHSLTDPDLAGVRGEDALARLPEAERADWQKLWQDVEALRPRAAGPPKKPDSAGH
jgi:serine/threonine-protein kinase